MGDAHTQLMSCSETGSFASSCQRIRSSVLTFLPKSFGRYVQLLFLVILRLARLISSIFGVLQTLQCCGLENEEGRMLKNVDLGANPVVLPFTDVCFRTPPTQANAGLT